MLRETMTRLEEKLDPADVPPRASFVDRQPAVRMKEARTEKDGEFAVPAGQRPEDQEEPQLLARASKAGSSANVRLPFAAGCPKRPR